MVSEQGERGLIPGAFAVAVEAVLLFFLNLGYEGLQHERRATQDGAIIFQHVELVELVELPFLLEIHLGVNGLDEDERRGDLDFEDSFHDASDHSF